jgi:hypothetical protein
VAGFTITITPDDDPEAGTSIHVDTSAGSARISELTVRPAKGGTLSTDQLAIVNLNALISALASLAATTAAAPLDPATGQPETGPKTGPQTASSHHRPGTPAPTPAASPRSAGHRAYRRMPDPDIVLDAYRQVGGTTALARHFGVPRHTASSWLRRLRTMGHLDS